MKSIKTAIRSVKNRFVIGQQKPKSDLPKIFYCHVPKCAGTAISSDINNRLYKRFQVGTFRIVPEATLCPAKLFSIEMMRAREIILSYNLSNSNNYFGTGHVRCNPKFVNSFNNEWNFITILRDPIDRWISEYVYNTFKKDSWNKNTLPIDEYINSESAITTGISFVRYFSSMPGNYNGNTNEFVEEAIENLKMFNIVGIIENIETFSRLFNQQFNTKLSIKKRNKSPNNQAFINIKSNKSILKKIELHCESDIKIYNHFFSD